MKTLAANLVLALLWITMTGRPSASNFVLGLFVAYLVLAWAHEHRSRSAYFRKVPEVARFLTFFLRELLVSSLRVAYDVITPRHRMRPAILAVPLDAQTDVEITTLAALLSLTPGTLTLDVSPDRKVLFVHAMFVDDPERTKATIKKGFEARVLRLLR